MFDDRTVDFIAFEAYLDVSQKELDSVCRNCSNSLVLDFDDGIVFCSNCGPCYRIHSPVDEPVKPPYEDDNDEV